MASTLMFWNKQNSNSQNGNDAKNTKNGRNWLHAPDVLVNGHVAYLVKFLGSTPVEQAKGIEVVKEAIRRLQFTQQMKKAEGGSNVKTKKVEITVSVDGVAIQEPRTQTILHQFPLHKISYCADEKGVKKFFSFIAKTGASTATTPSLSAASDDTHSSHSTDQDGQHECFVFISNKLASDITLTIGQAFDLAYRRYVSDSGKSVETTKLQSQNKQLENTINAYRQRLKDLSELVPKSDLDKLLLRLGLRDICEVPALENGIDSHHHVTTVNGSKTPDLGIDVSLPNNDDQLLIETSPKHFAPIVPPRNIQNQINSTLEAFKPSVGTKMEGLLLNSDSDSDFDPRAPDNDSPSIGGNKISNDLFGFEPPKQSVGQQLFSSNNSHNSFTNGNTGTSNGFGAPTSPPPILAPPPQKSAPRRTTSAHQNSGMANGNGYQDLFGSAPFNPQACDETSFDSSTGDASFTSNANLSAHPSSSFTEEVKGFANKMDSVLALNNAYNTHNTSHGLISPPPVASTQHSNPFATLVAPTKNILRTNPLASVRHNAAPYDVFQNASDEEPLSDHIEKRLI
ncbi:PTB domain-containing adapter protein ced-6 isoform X2 [Sabethes cyaneus]|uniref:PTB domain-containing adapter protein ced-6 isoform X2 n=1 Tax=Sabethes cyaneus TaxID=53552 RepID=UPI00237DBA84|nr:PTB domain-containing adapter protein ced-6 isoform X2 [Sabethes cyaneus]